VRELSGREALGWGRECEDRYTNWQARSCYVIPAGIRVLEKCRYEIMDCEQDLVWKALNEWTGAR
jgi:hypothetical protein